MKNPDDFKLNHVNWTFAPDTFEGKTIKIIKSLTDINQILNSDSL